jgi:hypothetical protein
MFLSGALNFITHFDAMRKSGVAFFGLALIGLGLASCGRHQGEQRAAWRDAAEAACMARGEVQTSAYVSLRGAPIQGPGSCGMEKPLRVSAFAGGRIGLTSTQTLSCPIIATTDRFLEKVVQPAAMAVLGVQVIEMKTGSYSCRAMNNGSGTTRRSEHSYGNALDIFAFRTSDGREITVRHGWRGTPQEQDFLREVFVGACEHYKTVLGPGADMFHYDHFHVDLARHNGGRSICRPVIKYTPRRDLPLPDPARNMNAFNQTRQAPFPLAQGAAQRPRAIDLADAGPMAAPGGPIRLPGSGHVSEEVVIGDIEGDVVDPDNDPFAIEEARRPGQPAQPARMGMPASATSLPVAPGQQSYRWSSGPAPAAPAPPVARAERPLPPRF